MIAELKKSVVQQRVEVELRKAEAAALYEVVKTTAEYSAYEERKAAQKNAEEELAITEQSLRNEALKIYATTKDKKVSPGVNVKVRRIVEYAADAITEWVKANAPAMLVVDWKSFDKVAEKIGAPVSIKEEPYCTLASKSEDFDVS